MIHMRNGVETAWPPSKRNGCSLVRSLEEAANSVGTREDTHTLMKRGYTHRATSAPPRKMQEKNSKQNSMSERSQVAVAARTSLCRFLDTSCCTSSGPERIKLSFTFFSASWVPPNSILVHHLCPRPCSPSLTVPPRSQQRHATNKRKTPLTDNTKKGNDAQQGVVRVRRHTACRARTSRATNTLTPRNVPVVGAGTACTGGGGGAKKAAAD